MGSALRLLSFVVVLTQLSQATQSALELLSEEENEFHQRRLDFDDWCNREIASQEKQRKELSELQGDDAAEDIEQFEVSEKLLEVARQLQPSPVELKVANVTLTALKAVQSDVAARAPRFFWRETRGLQAVEKLLQEATSKVSGFSLAQTLDRGSLEAQLLVLKAEQKNASEVLAARRAKVLAARSGRQVLATALAQTEASLSEAAGLCGLGRAVLNRSEATGQLLARKALELIGMVEGSPTSVSSIPIPVVPESAPAGSVSASAGSDLLALSKQLQLQQQQVQQQLEEVKQMKAAVKPKAELAEIESHETLQLEDPEPSEPKKLPARKKSKVPAMSLAAETAEQSRNEVSHAKVEAVKSAQEAITPAPKVDLPAKSYKSKESDEDGVHLQAPKDFPAALRGGWQALLAKKRAEGFKKAPAKTEEHSSIMDLMQTPKTYTAWQPDKGPSQPADKAKEDLLAAEKAFDDDDDSEKNMFNKKKAVKSFLQLDGDDSKVDLGGPDPLSFFQLGSMTDLSSGTAPPHSEVGMLLEKYAEMTNSSTLLELSKSQLQTQDFEMLLQKLEGESDDDRSEEFCASVLPKDTSVEAKLKAELKKYYLDAKARHEAQALQREVVAREHLVSVFGNTSQRFGAVQELLQHSFMQEEARLQRLETQLVQLEATRSAHTAAQELHEVLGQLRLTMRHAQEELEDTLASATSRQQQAEKLDQQSLQKLVAHVQKLETSLGNVDSSPQKLEKLCGMAAESRAQRQEKHKMEVEALRTAKDLNELL